MAARTRTPQANRTPAHVLIVEARFYEAISNLLAAGAMAELTRRGATYERVAVPGALEIPTAITYGDLASDLAVEGELQRAPFDGYVALGCVIRGATSHYDLVAGESARALMDLGVARGMAIGNGILTVENEAQARERADPNRLDKGGGAAAACLDLIRLRRSFELD